MDTAASSDVFAPGSEPEPGFAPDTAFVIILVVAFEATLRLWATPPMVTLSEMIALVLSSKIIFSEMPAPRPVPPSSPPPPLSLSSSLWPASENAWFAVDCSKLPNWVERCEVQTSISCKPLKAASIPANRPKVLPTVASVSAE